MSAGEEHHDSIEPSTSLGEMTSQPSETPVIEPEACSMHDDGDHVHYSDVSLGTTDGSQNTDSIELHSATVSTIVMDTPSRQQESEGGCVMAQSSVDSKSVEVSEVSSMAVSGSSFRTVESQSEDSLSSDCTTIAVSDSVDATAKVGKQDSSTEALQPKCNGSQGLAVSTREDGTTEEKAAADAEEQMETDATCW